MYLRHNCTQEFIGDLRDISQLAVSRIITVLVPMIKAVPEEFVPTAKDAIRLVKGKVCLVDGTITPGWSYAEQRELWSRKHGTTGFCVQLIGLLDGTPIWISDPLSGNTHDKKAFDNTETTDIIKESPGGHRRKGLSRSRPVHADQETPRPETQQGRKESRCRAIRTPCTHRTGRGPLQELVNAPRRLPTPLRYIPGRFRRGSRIVPLLDQVGLLNKAPDVWKASCGPNRVRHPPVGLPATQANGKSACHGEPRTPKTRRSLRGSGHLQQETGPNNRT